MKKMVAMLLGLCLLFNLTACGTLIHPERKGQARTGDLDLAIVALDAIGLVFYLVPGIIAFAIDYNYGTLYMPGGSASTLTPEEMENIVKNGKVDMESLEALVEEKTGESVELSKENLEVSYLMNKSQLPVSLMSDTQVAVLQ